MTAASATHAAQIHALRLRFAASSIKTASAQWIQATTSRRSPCDFLRLRATISHGGFLPDPLLAPLAALAAGLVAARFLPFASHELLAATLVLASIALFALWKSTRRVATAACLAGLVFAGAFVGLAHRPGPAPALDAQPREVVILSGCVVEPPVFSPDRERFLLELDAGARAQVSLYTKPGERPQALHYGQRVELDARVRPTRNFRNPGSFDYAGYLARRDIYWTASVVSHSPVKILPGDCGTPFGRAIFGLRTTALERLEQLYRGDAYKTSMMQAVLIGESTNLERVWTEDFRRTGTYHALVISGLHITVLAAFFLFLMRLCFVPEPIALSLTTLAGWTYALVSGWQAPVIRGAAGFTFFVVVRYFYRRPRLLNILAAIALGFVLCDPEQMFEASFQLSFLSVAALGALAMPLIERTSAPLVAGLSDLADSARDPRLAPRVAHFRVELRLLAETVFLWTRIPQRVCLAAIAWPLRAFFWTYEMVVLSTCIQFGLALPMAVYFHRLSITGLTANLLIVPAMSAVVPIGFIAIFTGWKLPAVIAGWLLSFSQWAAGLHVRWEPDWRIPAPPLWLAIALVAAILTVAIFRRRRVIFFPALTAAVALLALVVWHPFPPQVVPGSLELTAIDVGQSESLFLAFPDGKRMLLDGGGFPNSGRLRRPQLDIGEDVVSPYLWSRSIRRLDVVALSHAHEDHIGGLPAIIRNFRPRELWTGAMADSPDWRHLRDVAQRLGVKIVPLQAGQSFRFGGAEVDVLAPLPDYQVREAAHNNDSLVFRLHYGHHSFLLTGDIEHQVERELVASGVLQPTNVLKIPHHGSRTSATTPFLDALHPAFGVISAGFGNAYGLPNRNVLERLEERHVEVLRTDLDGLVSIRTNGRRFELDTMRLSPPSGLYAAF